MKIKILEPLGIPNEELINTLERAIGPRHQIVTYADRKVDISILQERAKDADILIFSNIPFPAEVLAACPNLRYICCAFTGLDHIDLDYCKAHNITVQNCAGYSTTAVAELVFGLVFGLLRQIPAADKLARSGSTKEALGQVGGELKGKKFGIIGLGAIGQEVARLAGAFGCEVLAYSRTKKEIPGVNFVSLAELLDLAQIVSLHVPLTAETRGLIGKNELELMRPDALLINTARGPVVDTVSLAEALKAGKIAGAGIDVFDLEPPLPPDHSLIGLKNVILTPHLAFATQEAFKRRAEIAARRLAKWLARRA